MTRLGARAGIICCQKRDTRGGKGEAHVGARAGDVWGARSRHVWEKGTCEGKGEACAWQRRGTLWGEKIRARVAGGQERGTYRTRAGHVRRQGLDVCGGKGRVCVGQLRDM